MHVCTALFEPGWLAGQSGFWKGARSAHAGHRVCASKSGLWSCQRYRLYGMGRAIDASSRNSQYYISFIFLVALISKAAKPLAKEIGQVTIEDKGRHHKRMHVFGNSIVYRNHKVCDGLASLYDGVPSYIVLLK